MRFAKPLIGSVIAGLILTAAVAQERDFSKVEVKSTKLADNLYMLEGAGGNIGLLIGPQGAGVVDDQFAPLAPKIQAAIASITDKPVKFVLNTHFHFDHTGGNEAFGRAGAVIVAHDNTRARLSVEQVRIIVSATLVAVVRQMREIGGRDIASDVATVEARGFEFRQPGIRRSDRALQRVGSMPMLGSHSYLSVRFVAVSGRLQLDGGQERGRSPFPVRRSGAGSHFPRRAPARMVSRHPAW